MRNYVAELKQLGYSLKDISGEVGMSAAQLSRIKTGKIKLQSGTKEYETIRNVSRRLSYREARKAGLTSSRASGERRTLISPERRTKESESVREVKSKQETTRYQMRILALFWNFKTKESQFSQGFSHAYLTIDIDMMQEEAVSEAQSRLGGSNWKLQRIAEREIMEYRLRADDDGDDDNGGDNGDDDGDE